MDESTQNPIQVPQEQQGSSRSITTRMAFDWKKVSTVLVILLVLSILFSAGILAYSMSAQSSTDTDRAALVVTEPSPTQEPTPSLDQATADRDISIALSKNTYTVQDLIDSTVQRAEDGTILPTTGGTTPPTITYTLQSSTVTGDICHFADVHIQRKEGESWIHMCQPEVDQEEYFSCRPIGSEYSATLHDADCADSSPGGFLILPGTYRIRDSIYMQCDEQGSGALGRIDATSCIHHMLLYSPEFTIVE